MLRLAAHAYDRQSRSVIASVTLQKTKASALSICDSEVLYIEFVWLSLPVRTKEIKTGRYKVARSLSCISQLV